MADLPVKVYLLPPGQVITTVPSLAAACFEQMRREFALQGTTAHSLAPTAEEAGLILAPIQGAAYGECLEALRSSGIYRRHAPKIVVYSPNANQFPALRGLYPAASSHWVRRGWALPAHYISAHIHKFAFTPDELQKKDILFSFVGASRTHPIRDRIVQWRHPGGLVIDSSAKNEQEYWWEKPDKERFVDSFRDATRRSKFVICPRGVSPSSIRLFEAMEAGAVPVIVADNLKLPLGPRWQEFSFRVLERDVDDIPRLIEGWEARAGEMGATARRAWDAYFSPQASVGSVVAWAQLLLKQSHRRPAALRMQEYISRRLIKAKVRHAFGR